MCTHNKDEQLSDGGEKTGMEEGEDMFDTGTPPVFTELLLRMIEELSDDIVSWSIAGDSFIIKQMPAFEALLPAYYSHGKFSSFARQLNYYGFRRVKRTPSQRLSSTDGGGQGAAAAGAATTKGLAWDQFSHPLFRRGRTDLLAGINRHKDGARLKPGKADMRELDMLNSLRADVGALSGDFKTANGKLDRIMSLLSDVAGGQNQTAPNATSRAAVSGGGGGVGGRSGLQDGNTGGSTVAPAEVVHGGSVSFGAWIAGGENNDGGTHRGGQDGGVGGASPGFSVGPRVSVGHQQQGLGQYPVGPPPPRWPSSAQQYPVGPIQVRQGEVLPPLAEALAARTTESGSTGPSRQRQPPHHQPM